MRSDCTAPIAELPAPWTSYMARYVAIHYAGAFYMPPHWRRLLLTARAAQGAAMGLLSSALAVLANEVAPFDKRRQVLDMLTRISIAVGLVAANAANMLMERRIHGWRKTNAGASVVAVVAMFAVFFLPASPKWTCQRKGCDEAEKVLRRLWRTSNVRLELDSFVLNCDTSGQAEKLPRSYKEAVMKLLVNILRQTTGISVMLTFGALIFKGRRARGSVGRNASGTRVLGRVRRERPPFSGVRPPPDLVEWRCQHGYRSQHLCGYLLGLLRRRSQQVGRCAVLGRCRVAAQLTFELVVLSSKTVQCV